jgi:hypothetical protein
LIEENAMLLGNKFMFHTKLCSMTVAEIVWL